MTKRTAINILKYAIGIGLMTLVVWLYWDPANGPGLKAIWQKHVVKGEPIRYGYFACAIAMCLAGVLQTFVRWGILVRALGLPFTVMDSLRLGFVGYYYNTLLPGSVGGDLVKAFYIAREQDRRTAAVATVLIDRAVGLWALFWLVSILGTFFWLTGRLVGESARVCGFIIGAAVAIVAVSLIVWFVMGRLSTERANRFAGRLERIRKVGGSAAECWRAIWMYRVQGKAIWIALAMSILGHVGFVLGFYFSGLTLQEEAQIPTLTESFLVVPIGMAVQAGIPTPGGLGAGEVFIGQLFKLLKYAPACGALMWFTNRIITWIVGFLGYLVYVQMKPSLAAELTEARSDPAAMPVASDA